MAIAEEVELEGAGGERIRGLLTRPEGDAGGAERPGLVLIHEVFGLDAHMAALAGRLADEGFAVLAPDLYSREGTPGPASSAEDPSPSWSADQIRAAVAGLPDNRALGDLEAAARWLGERPDVDGERVGAMGFCMGGALAFLLGCRSTRIAAVVDFYGRILYSELSANKPVQPLEMALNLSCPLLGLFGADDSSVPAEDVERMRSVLSQFAKHFDIVTYPGAGHGFFNDTRDSHHPEAAADAWSRALDFLRESLELD